MKFSEIRKQIVISLLITAVLCVLCLFFSKICALFCLICGLTVSAVCAFSTYKRYKKINELNDYNSFVQLLFNCFHSRFTEFACNVIGAGICVILYLHFCGCIACKGG